MRRLVSILLLAVFGLPFLSPALAAGESAGAGLPACCRRNGAHHCAMEMSERQQSSSHDPQWQGPVERCPFCPAKAVAVHPDPLSGPEVSDAIFAGIVSHPAVSAQTESKWRIARDRSRQKRGPPANLRS